MISPFEYIIVLISIILGMGITQILSGLAGIILRWNNIKIYWPHSILMLLLFTIHIQDWWATYELHTIKLWYLPMFLFIILYPVNLYILARILFPLRWTGQPIDLKKFYFENFRKIYLFMIFLPVHSILSNHFIGGYALGSQLLQFVLTLMLIVMVVLNRREEWIHKTLTVLFLVIFITTLIVDWNAFLITSK
ncbi:MAG: hypothetical protein JNJ75_13490 [Cyclobacteriaceae bacterium]|nr:hypothetical protein [Cyclobacteriaceae bacterium]